MGALYAATICLCLTALLSMDHDAMVRAKAEPLLSVEPESKLRNKAMFASLGNTVYRLSCVLAVLILLADAFEWYAEPRHGQVGWIVLTGLAVAAVMIWLIGRAFREAR